MENKKIEIVNIENKIYIENVNINLDGYDAKIIGFEKIDGIAKCCDIGKDYIVFNKVGTTLSEYVKDNKLSEQDLINFIEDIYKVTKTIENYLIPQESILLATNAIIINNHNLEFIAVPGIQQDMMFEVSKLLIRLLRFVDVNDKEALTLAYSLFVRSSKDNYKFEDLLEVVEYKKYA